MKEGVDGDKRVDILLAMETPSRRDFMGCLQAGALAGLAGPISRDALSLPGP